MIQYRPNNIAPALWRRYSFALILKTLVLLILAGLLIAVPLIDCARGKQKAITALCGSASKPAMEETAKAFKEKTGITVYLVFSGSLTMLS